MTKRFGRLLVTSNFLTFAMVAALCIRMEVDGRKAEQNLLALKHELQGRSGASYASYLPGRTTFTHCGPAQPVNLGGGLFPDSWRWSPGGLARNYPAGDSDSVELPTWDDSPVEEGSKNTNESEGGVEKSSANNIAVANNDRGSDIWYRGFMLNKRAEELAGQGKLLEALNSYNEALPLMKSVLTEFPTFHHDIVKKRISLIVESRKQIKSEMIRIGDSRLY